MDLTSMKSPPADKGSLLVPDVMADSPPEYPYGLRIHLEQPELAKLGITELPAPGEPYELHAVAVVESVSAHDSQEGKPSRTLSLQITDLAVVRKQVTTAGSLYGAG